MLRLNLLSPPTTQCSPSAGCWCEHRPLQQQMLKFQSNIEGCLLKEELVMSVFIWHIYKKNTKLFNEDDRFDDML